MKHLLLLAVLFAGCNIPQPDTALVPVKAPGRFEVQRVGVFEDQMAYNGRRGIYLIRDTENETEFVGISGIGISELGSHTTQSGKTTVTVPDER